MKSKQTLPTVKFEIDHLDPMGQGVSKKDNKITFISGTLPQEKGRAKVYKRSKGVQFARLESLDEPSERRVAPSCPHFEQCPGCHYQHVSYEDELVFKKSALERHLKKLEYNEIELVPAPTRLGYRNRVQLHYRHKYIGMLDSASNQVVEIPECKIFRDEIKDAFDLIYKGDWQETHDGHGHCELYFNDGQVNLNWNAAYSDGGFTQVFPEMNEILKQRLKVLFDQVKINSVLDLFSGNGNLSDDLDVKKRVLVDNFKAVNAPENFYALNLFEEDALTRFSRKYKKEKFDALLVDPPRKGFANLGEWVRRIKPKHLFYVSCNPASLARDLDGLKTKYKVKDVQLLDLFPSTSHFETLVYLRF